MNAHKFFEREIVLSSDKGRELTLWGTFNITFLVGRADEKLKIREVN